MEAGSDRECISATFLGAGPQRDTDGRPSIGRGTVQVGE